MARHRILFIRTDRMGDVLMNLPAVRLLRQGFPKAWIAMMVDESVEPLLNGHPDLDELFVVNAAAIKKNPFYRWKLLKRLRQARFDLAVVSNPDKHLHALVFWAGIRERVGYRRKRAFYLTHTKPDDKSSGAKHEIDANLELAALAAQDVRWDGRLELPVNAIAREKIKALLSEHGEPRNWVAVHAGTSNPRKKWDAGGFAAVCRWVSERGFAPLLIGGEEEKEASRRVADKSGLDVVDWTGRLSLAELSALFHDPRMRALVSSDSGPVHVAWMSGVPAVALYAQDAPGSDPRRWGPRDGKSRTIHKLMAQITSQEVCAELERVLE